MSKRPGINKSTLSRTLRNTKFTQALKVDFKRLFLAHSRKMIRQMLREFDSHPVTTEISSGPKAGNTSNTLSGRGNLFSFIGFERGKDPIKPLRALLQATTVEFLAIKSGVVEFKINFPTNEQIYEVTPMPWARGRSWVRGIEHGMSGLGQYMYSNQQVTSSRSGTAIQSESQKRGGKFRNVAYLSQIKKNFMKNIRSFSAQGQLVK